MRSATTIMLLLGSFLISAQSQDPVISLRMEEGSFREFAAQVTGLTGIHVYYRSDWVEDLSIQVDADSLPLSLILDQVLAGSGLHASPWNGHFIVLPGEKLITEIPQSSVASPQTHGSTPEEEGPGNTFLQTRSADVLQSLKIGDEARSSGGRAEITGKITDAKTGEDIVGATMFIRETRTGTVSDLNGNMTMQLKPGKYTAEFECLGYEKTTCQLEVFSDGSFGLEMSQRYIAIGEATVYGDRQMIITAKDPGIEKIAVRTIKEIPMMWGERDILKVSEMLPGIVSIGEGSSGLNVRGGNFDQNAFYINNVPVYNTAHLFGFFPAFNADIIQDFTIYKGHVPSRYGGKLSSVFDIETRQNANGRFNLRGGINPVSANLTMGAPLFSDSLSFLLSGRASYSDWILSRINDPLIRDSEADFYDVTASINYTRDKTQTDLFLYHSHDRFKLSDLSSYAYGNLGSSINLHHRHRAGLSQSLSLVGSQYTFNTVDQQQHSIAYQHRYRLQNFKLGTYLNHTHREHRFTYGIDLESFLLNRGKVEPYGNGSLRSTVDLGTEQAMNLAVHAADVFDLTPSLNLNAGFRLALYSYLGPREVYRYQDENHRDVRLISDTLTFGSLEPIQWYASPEFRFALNYQTDPRGSLKFAVNQMHQHLFMLNPTIALAPNTQWKLSDHHLKPSRGLQFSTGIFRTFWGNRLEGSLEAFYKWTRHFPEFRDGANFLSNPLVETEVLQGKQQSYGLEFFMKMNSRKLDGWMAYTWSRSRIRVDGGEIWNRINEGKTYPSNYDIPHVLNAIGSYHFTKRVTLSGTITYQTGRPATYPVAAYYIRDEPYVDFSDRNKYRIPDYFRLDLSLTLEGNLKRNKVLHSSWQLAVYNLTGRTNAYSVYFTSEDGKLNSYKYSIIGTQLLTLSWLMKIGNFETY